MVSLCGVQHVQLYEMDLGLFDGVLVQCATCTTLWNGLGSLVQAHLCSVLSRKGFFFFIVFCKHHFVLSRTLRQCDFAVQWDTESALLASISLAHFSMQYPWGRIKYFLRCYVVLQMFKRAGRLLRQEVPWHNLAVASTTGTLDLILAKSRTWFTIINQIQWDRLTLTKVQKMWYKSEYLFINLSS